MVTESHQPQISKRAEALKMLADYFHSFLLKYARGNDEDFRGVAEQMAVDAYKIVKQAEGF